MNPVTIFIRLILWSVVSVCSHSRHLLFLCVLWLRLWRQNLKSVLWIFEATFEGRFESRGFVFALWAPTVLSNRDLHCPVCCPAENKNLETGDVYSTVSQSKPVQGAQHAEHLAPCPGSKQKPLKIFKERKKWYLQFLCFR